MQTGTRNALPAYSLLFVPGNRPERFAKAVASGASAVILDLEDAVHPRDKVMARAAIRTFFASGGVAMIRINPLSTEWASQDLMLIQEVVVQQAAGIGRLTGVILPKTESTADVECVARYLPVDIPVLPLIETALGLLNAREIASAPSVLRLLFGTVDFCLDLNIEGYGEELNSYRAWLVLISRGAGLEPPVDGVTISLKDESALLTSTLAAKRIGFGGKLCIHPKDSLQKSG
jgi:citrate lyase subunit beta / citryl-CoA lyase